MSVWAQNFYYAKGNDIYFAFKHPTSMASRLLTISDSLERPDGIAIKLAELLNAQPSPATPAGEGARRADEGEAA